MCYDQFIRDLLPTATDATIAREAGYWEQMEAASRAESQAARAKARAYAIADMEAASQPEPSRQPRLICIDNRKLEQIAIHSDSADISACDAQMDWECRDYNFGRDAEVRDRSECAGCYAIRDCTKSGYFC